MRFKSFFLLAILIVPTSLQSESARIRIKKKIFEKEHILMFRSSDSVDRVFYSGFVSEIRKKNADLGQFNHTFFNPRFLKKTAEVKALLSDRTAHKNECGRRWALTIEETVIEGTYFNRSSDIVVFITGGFSNAHEYMAPFIKLFPSFDLVFFDMPGHGGRYEQDDNSFLNSLVNVDLSRITFGVLESEVIQKVAFHFLSKKKYATVAAVGRCYSVPFFARAAVEWEERTGTPLFDKLVLDSTFVSFRHFIPYFPALYCSRYPAPVIRHVGSSWPVSQLFYALTECVLGKSFAEFPATYEYLEKLEHTDLFFIHSRADVAIPMSDFELLWSKLDHIKNKGVLFTENKHAMSHIKQKEIYKELSERFITTSFTDFASFLTTSSLIP